MSEGEVFVWGGTRCTTTGREAVNYEGACLFAAGQVAVLQLEAGRLLAV